MTEPIAAVLRTLDETDGATLTDIARRSGKPISTIQRAVEALVEAGLVIRTTRRGRLRLAPTAPRRALRELADWRLANGRQGQPEHGSDEAPATIRDPTVRRAWREAIDAIVATYRPERVILFGSQARGDARPGSDVDLLVVFSEVADRRERRVGIHRLLRGMPFAKDILVASNEDLARPFIGSALAAAVREGVTVYER